MNSSKKWILWAFCGLVLCAGIVMIGLGASYLVEYDNRAPCLVSTTAVTNPPTISSIAASMDATHKRIFYTRQSQILLDVQLARSTDGRDPLDVVDAGMCVSEVEICQNFVLGTENSMVVQVGNQTPEPDDAVTCFNTIWSVQNGSIEPTDCFPMTGQWFGGAEMYFQDWPINNWSKHMSFYLSGDMYANDQEFGSVLERYWLSSHGVALFVPADVPLHVSIEHGNICFKGSYTAPYKAPTSPPGNILKYTTCFGDSAQVVHEYMIKKYFARPPTLPDLRMMKSPIWSTWAQYKKDINQSVVLDYAQRILDHNFTNSQLEIDDGYETTYGDYTFDPDKFPNASEMIRTLHDFGFRVTTWVTPFIHRDSVNYDSGNTFGNFIVNGNTGNSGSVVWWNGVASPIDFTKPEACDWYEEILSNVRSDFGVDSFKFDAGEINYVTGVPDYQLHENLANLGRYTQYYAECAASCVELPILPRFGTQIEVRAAWNSQHLPVFVRMMDKDSTWSRAKGLKTLIPTALTFSLLGYPYILPDMIGGNGYGENFVDTEIPERELFIRWLEITAFLPSMQFSFAPWQYDDETVRISQTYVTLHETVVFEALQSACSAYADGSSALGPIRPIWWATNGDEKAFTVDDEFMVGDSFLVAPIVENATRFRDVYLPGPMYRDGLQRMAWQDMLRGEEKLILGGTLLRNYRIELDEISWWKLHVL